MENKAKDLLKSYRRIKKEIEAIEASIRELRTNKITPSLIQDGMPHGSGCSDLSAYAAKLDELERKMEDKRWEALGLYAEIEGYIMELPDETERALCRFRYITGMQWEEICVTMGYGWAQIHRIHSKALKEIEKKYNKINITRGTMKVLVACEESQTVCKAFREKGHEAYSCDIQEPSGGHPEWHILGDAIPVLQGGTVTTMDCVSHEIGSWDLLIAHPPCTYLSNAGARHLWKDGHLNAERVKNGIMAKDFFMEFYRAGIPKICVENPVPSGIYCMPEKTQIIQPYQFGHPMKKRTCLWIKGLPPLQPTDIIPEEECESTKVPGNWYNKGGKERQKNRSKTFPGIAAAMADQWG